MSVWKYLYSISFTWQLKIQIVHTNLGINISPTSEKRVKMEYFIAIDLKIFAAIRAAYIIHLFSNVFTGYSHLQLNKCFSRYNQVTLMNTAENNICYAPNSYLFNIWQINLQRHHFHIYYTVNCQNKIISKYDQKE